MRTGRKPLWDEKIAPRLEEIKAWCRDGYTDNQIAENLGIDRATFYRYKAKKSDLRDALKISKAIADLNVENSLYVRACGCKITETVIEEILVQGSDGNYVALGHKKQRTVVKEIPPDPTSAFFWLQNRSKGKWRSTRNIEITGKDGGPIETKVLTKKQYMKYREEMFKHDDC